MRIARVIDTSGAQVYAAATHEGQLHRIVGDITSPSVEITDEPVEVRRWLPPIEPRTIICVGLNYRKHAEEGGKPIPERPLLFMKNPAAAIGHDQPILLPKVCGDEVDYECELAVVIKQDTRDISVENALDAVWGYTCGNDVSARKWQFELGGGQWIRAKGFDTFAPLGPYLVTPDEIPDPNKLPIRTLLNGHIVQESNTSDMIFSVAELISFISQDTTVQAGTVILTGTPSGVGWWRQPRRVLEHGDAISVHIDGVGILNNSVLKA